MPAGRSQAGRFKNLGVTGTLGDTAGPTTSHQLAGKKLAVFGSSLFKSAAIISHVRPVSCGNRYARQLWSRKKRIILARFLSSIGKWSREICVTESASTGNSG